MKADMNADGIVDFVYSGCINFGRADSTYYSVVFEDLMYSPSVSRIVDLDTNNELDVLVSTFDRQDGTSVIYALMQNGGEFTKTIISQNTYSGLALEVVDFDSDGDLDLFLCGSEHRAFIGNDVHTTFLRNDGVAGYTSVHTDVVFATTNGDYEFFDEDSDGDNDLIMTGSGVGATSAAYLYRNQGGTFVNSNISIETSTQSRIAIADLDGDGDKEIVLRGRDFQNAISILNKLPNGNYEDRADSFMKNSTFGGFGDLFLEDVNGDGLLDIVSGGSISGVGSYLKVYRNLGNLDFFPIVQSSSLNFPGFQRSVMHDVNGDGLKDLISLSGSLSGVSNRTYIFVNRGDGRFEEAEYTYFKMGLFETVELVNLNDNNLSEVFFQKNQQQEVYDDSIVVYESNSGNWDATDYGFKQLVGNKSIIADFDNDGDQDVIINGQADQGYQSFFYGNNNGLISEEYELMFGLDYDNYKTYDVNNDGYQDIVMGGINDSSQNSFNVKAYLNDGQNYFDFSNQIITFIGCSYGNFDAGDFNKDGFTDFVSTGYLIQENEARAGVFLDKNPDTYGAISLPELTPLYYGQVEVHDFNNDGWDDFYISGQIAGGSDWKAQLFLNDQQGSFQMFLMPNNGLSNSRVHFFDYDQDGILDLFTSGKSQSGIIKNELFNGNNDGTFSFSFNFPMAILAKHISSGDVSGDGQPDLLVVGEGYTRDPLSRLYLNESTSYLSLAEHENKDHNIVMFPNPSDGIVSIHGNVNELIQEINVFDITGRRVDLNYVKVGSQKFLLEFKNSGYFLIQIETSNGQFTKTVVIN